MNDEVLYKGHGQVEIYPINTSILGIVSHELRHANFNRYIALLKNKDVEQDIKITLQYKDGKLYPDKAYTEAKFKDKVNQEELILKIIFLKIKIRKLKNSNKDNPEIEIYERELNNLQKEFFQKENLLNLHEFKKDNAQLIGFFREIYFYQKFNLPPVELNSTSFKNAYDVENKLNEIYRKNLGNYEFQFKNVHSTDSLTIASKEFAYQKVYEQLENLNAYLNNFQLPLKRAVSNFSDYFNVYPNDNAEEKQYNISVINKNKSLIIFSKKFYDVYAALNLSGNPKINGIEIEIETSDSLYDIMEKINWGEDINHNYQLDEGEDSNSNNELDGGTKEHGVFAYIENNRLYLKNVLTGDIKIVIDDDNEIFHELGIIEENPLNNEIYFPNILQNGEDAEIEIDGERLKSHNGIFNYKNMIITIKKVIDNATFKIESNDEQIFNKIEEFVSNYNNVITILNNYLKENQELENDLGLMIIKRGMKIAFFNNYDSLKEKGLELNNDKEYLSQIEILTLDDNKLKKFNNSIVDKLYNIGIKSEEDETISIDRDRLFSAIKEDKKELKQLFFSKNGIVNNLKKFLEKVLNEDYGLIKTEVDNISSEKLKKLKKNLTKEHFTFEYFLSKLQSLENVINVEREENE